MTDMTPANNGPIGELIDGRYSVVRRIADGGMATVYEATDVRLGRTVALKMMHTQLAQGPHRDQFIRHFRREARSAARIANPHIVQVYDFGEWRGLDFLVMEYVDGSNLRYEMARQGRFSVERMLHVVGETLDGLAAAHREGVVHRDIKPENILLNRRGHVQITDFGLAKAASQATMATTGMLLGTASYLAPEMIERNLATKQGDLYSVGVMAWELICGVVPFESDNVMTVVFKHVHDDIPDLKTIYPDIPEKVSAFVRHLTMRAPEARPQDADAALEEYHALVQALTPGQLAWRAQQAPSPQAVGSTMSGLAGLVANPAADGAAARGMAINPTTGQVEDITVATAATNETPAVPAPPASPADGAGRNDEAQNGARRNGTAKASADQAVAGSADGAGSAGDAAEQMVDTARIPRTAGSRPAHMPTVHEQDDDTARHDTPDTPGNGAPNPAPSASDTPHDAPETAPADTPASDTLASGSSAPAAPRSVPAPPRRSASSAPSSGAVPSGGATLSGNSTQPGDTAPFGDTTPSSAVAGGAPSPAASLPVGIVADAFTFARDTRQDAPGAPPTSAPAPAPSHASPGVSPSTEPGATTRLPSAAPLQRTTVLDTPGTPRPVAAPRSGTQTDTPAGTQTDTPSGTTAPQDSRTLVYAASSDVEAARDMPTEPIDRKAAKKRTGVKLAVTLLLTVLLLAGASAVWWFFSGPGSYNELPAASDVECAAGAQCTVEGADWDSYRQTLDSLGIVYQVTERNDDTVAAGHIISTTPSTVGSHVSIRGGIVDVVVSQGPVMVTVPSDILDASSANGSDPVTALTNAGFTNVVHDESNDQYSLTVPEGAAISVDPAPGTTVDHNTQVTVVLSRGPKPVTFPDVVGKTRQDVEKALSDDQLNVTWKEEYSDSVESGVVISASSAAGDTLHWGDSVTVTVSKGPEMATVPNVVGKNYDDAAATLSALGFQVQKKTTILGDWTDQVRQQSVSAGDTVRIRDTNGNPTVIELTVV